MLAVGLVGEWMGGLDIEIRSVQMKGGFHNKAPWITVIQIWL